LQASWLRDPCLKIKVKRGAGFGHSLKKQPPLMENFASIRNLAGFVLPLAGLVLPLHEAKKRRVK
jgi:hypothetical protein